MEGEIITAQMDHVTLLTHDKRPTIYRHGLLTVTTHRVVWTDPSRRSAISAHLYYAARNAPVENKSSPFSQKALLRIGKGVRLEFGSNSPGKNRDKFLTEVQQAVRLREWERIEEVKKKEEEKKSQQGEFVSRRLGASGVKDKVHARNTESKHAINTGFASLDQLRGQAEDLMKVAKTFQRASAEASRGKEENELLSMMAEMGIDSPVTKETSGGNVGVYREQLSRQIAEFLRVPILNVGGILTLSDAYCLVMRNRASVELVSPEDFRIACDFFNRLRLAIEVVQLESGVFALKLDSSRDSSGAHTLRRVAEERTSITPIDVVRIRHVPIQRATFMLEDAERSGFLARDATTEGLRFFPNLFDSFIANAAQASSM